MITYINKQALFAHILILFLIVIFCFVDIDTKKDKHSRETTIQNRCSPDAAMNFFHNQVLMKLTAEHIRLLCKTPFLHLFAFPKGTQASRVVLHQILLMWDRQKRCFGFNGSDLHFTSEEVSLVMCLPSKGIQVNCDRTSYTDSPLRWRHFRDMTRITKPDLEKAILKAIDDKCAPADVVGLLVMYLFTSTLFPQANGCVPTLFFPYVEIIEKIRTYNWGDAVHGLLMDSIPSCSSWCRRMEKGGEDCGGSSEKSSPVLPVCTLALIVSYFNSKLIVKHI